MGSAIFRGCAISCENTDSRQTSPLFPGIGDALLLLRLSCSVVSRGLSLCQFMAVTTPLVSLEQPHLEPWIPQPIWLDPECDIIKRERASNTNPSWFSRRAFSRPYAPRPSNATVFWPLSIPN